MNHNNSSYIIESQADAEYNPYIHGPSKGEYVKSQIGETLPSALLAPDLIKVEVYPMKVVYDFTKRSKNMKMVEDGVFENFEFVERCDSHLR